MGKAEKALCFSLLKFLSLFLPSGVILGQSGGILKLSLRLSIIKVLTVHVPAKKGLFKFQEEKIDVSALYSKNTKGVKNILQALIGLFIKV